MSNNDKQHENWCFRSETARLLALNVAQIHTGLSEGDSSIDTLSSSFQLLANFCGEIQQLESNQDSPQIEQVKQIAESMSGQVNNAIMAFQFYDRLCQRLDHVQSNLNMLSGLITDEAHIVNADGWQELRDKIHNFQNQEDSGDLRKAGLRIGTLEHEQANIRREGAEYGI